MERLTAFLLLITCGCLSSTFAGGNLGASSECINSDCTVTASSSAPSLAISILIAGFWLFRKQGGMRVADAGVVGVWRRFTAWALDFFTLALVVTPFLTLPVLIAEARYTPVFQWRFSRDYARADDWVIILLPTLMMFFLWFLYYYLHERNGRQTVGQYIAGYRVVAAGGDKKPEYVVRVLFACVGICLWPISVFFALRNERKLFWWDLQTSTVPVRAE